MLIFFKIEVLSSKSSALYYKIQSLLYLNYNISLYLSELVVLLRNIRRSEDGLCNNNCYSQYKLYEDDGVIDNNNNNKYFYQV